MRKALTPKLLDSLKPSAGKRYEVRDNLIIGLLLRVSKTGGKVWYVLPRVRGRAVRIKIGTYPILTLAQARERARQLLGDAQLGRLIKERLDAERLPTLSKIIPDFIELYAKKRNKDWKETQRVLTKFASLGRLSDLMLSGGENSHPNHLKRFLKQLETDLIRLGHRELAQASDRLSKLLRGVSIEQGGSRL